MHLIVSLILALVAIVNSAPIDEANLIYKGDMIFQRDPTKVSRNVYMYTLKWDKGVIPYTFDAASAFSIDEKVVILTAMRKIEQKTKNCLSFKQRTTESEYVIFKDTTTGCNSYVGRAGIAGQWISLQKGGCIHEGIVMHELLHTAGFEHEHERSDRDRYIKVILKNVVSDYEFAFSVIPAATVNTFDIPYDYYSIMHYGSWAFSNNGRPTIIPIDPTIDLTRIGQRVELTDSDVKRIKSFYHCPV